jgi:hypothetical protein
MGQPHRNLIKMQHPDAQIDSHAHMLPIAGYADFAAYIESYGLRRNLLQRRMRRPSYRAFPHMTGFNQALSLRRHYGAFDHLFYGTQVLAAKIDGYSQNTTVLQPLPHSLLFLPIRTNSHS